MNFLKSMKKHMFDFMIGFFVGLIITILIYNFTSPEVTKTQAILKDTEQYGKFDGRIFNEEISRDWASGAELGFKPLNIKLDEDIQEFIYCLSYGYNIEFSFVMGLIEQESNFNVNAVSRTNDYGLMQINKSNHKWLTEKFGFDDYLDPYQNTRAGLYILRKLFEKHQDPSKVLMAYHMGENGAKKLWDKGITQTDYSLSVLINAAEFKHELERKTNNE